MKTVLCNRHVKAGLKKKKKLMILFKHKNYNHGQFDKWTLSLLFGIMINKLGLKHISI